MSNISLRSLGFLTISLAVGVSAVAQDSTSTISKSETRAERSNFRISYFGDIEGTSLYAPGSALKYDEAGKANGNAAWFHEPGIDYRIGERTTIKIKAPFTHSSVRDDQGRDVVWDDLTMGIANSGIIRTENFNLYAGMSFSPAMTEYSRSRQRTGEVGSTIIPAYTFGSSGFRLEWVSLFKQYFYQPGQELNAKTKSNIENGRLSNFKAEFYPALLYALNEKSSAVLGGHLLYINNRNRGLNFEQLEDSLHLGLHHKFNSSLSIRPEIRINNPSLSASNENLMKSTEVGMLIFGSIQ